MSLAGYWWMRRWKRGIEDKIYTGTCQFTSHSTLPEDIVQANATTKANKVAPHKVIPENKWIARGTPRFPNWGMDSNLNTNYKPV